MRNVWQNVIFKMNSAWSNMETPAASDKYEETVERSREFPEIM